jgi:hypothetical protein
MVFETIAFADFAIRAGVRNLPWPPVRPMRLVLFMLVVAAALGYRQYRLAQARDPAAATGPAPSDRAT